VRAGTLEPIETADLGMPTAQAGARVLKSRCSKALTTTGLRSPGVNHGCVRTRRLPRRPPDQAGTATPSTILTPGVADLIAEKVLPTYGPGDHPELRANFDPKGRGGHPRRLRLIARARSGGHSRVGETGPSTPAPRRSRVAAIECLGGDGADLSYLLEQAAAKAKEVREAAYTPAPLAALRRRGRGRRAANKRSKARTSGSPPGRSAAARTRSCCSSLSPRPSRTLRYSSRKPKISGEVGKRIGRLQSLLSCMAGSANVDADAFVANCLTGATTWPRSRETRRRAWTSMKTVVGIMASGSKGLQGSTLAEAHASLSADVLGIAFRAASPRHARAAGVRDVSSPTSRPSWTKRRSSAIRPGRSATRWPKRWSADIPITSRGDPRPTRRSTRAGWTSP